MTQLILPTSRSNKVRYDDVAHTKEEKKNKVNRKAERISFGCPQVWQSLRLQRVWWRDHPSTETTTFRKWFVKTNNIGNCSGCSDACHGLLLLRFGGLCPFLLLIIHRKRERVRSKMSSAQCAGGSTKVRVRIRGHTCYNLTPAILLKDVFNCWMCPWRGHL